MNQQQFMQPQQQHKASVGAVNIQIYNPSVTPSGAPSTDGYIPTGANYGNYMPPSYPPHYQQYHMPAGASNYYAQQMNNYAQPNIPAKPVNPNGQNIQGDVKGNTSGKAQQPAGQKVAPKPVEKKEDMPPPPLTNEYIRTLENYLNSQNKELRFEAANQVVGEFRVHKSRREDPQLTALLNKIIQDPYQGVRLLGLSVIESGHAKGNEETIYHLKQMQGSNKVYNQDALLASKILLKMAGNKLQPKDPKKPKAPAMVQKAPQGQPVTNSVG